MLTRHYDARIYFVVMRFNKLCCVTSFPYLQNPASVTSGRVIVMVSFFFLLFVGAGGQLAPELLLDWSGQRWSATAHPSKYLEGEARASGKAIFAEHDGIRFPLNPEGLQEM